MLIYLLRHGLTQENLEKRYQGRRDVPLCPQGLAQLRRAGKARRNSASVSAQHLPRWWMPLWRRGNRSW